MLLENDRLILLVVILLFIISIICIIEKWSKQPSKSRKLIIQDNRFCEAISNSTNNLCANYRAKGEKYCYSHCQSKKYKMKVNNINNFTKNICGICYENKRKTVFKKLICGHEICKTCLSKWKQRSQTCPFCRKNI